MAIKSKKAGVLKTYGDCTHEIIPVQVEKKKMKWWCNQCNDYASKSHQTIIEKK